MVIGTSTCPLPAASEKSRAPCVNGPVGTDGGGDGGDLTPPAFVGGGGVHVGGGVGDGGCIGFGVRDGGGGDGSIMTGVVTS